MKIEKIVCFLFFIILSITSKAQNCPPNIDFELGNFNNWDCFIGDTDDSMGINVIHLFSSPPTTNRHEIISDSTAVDHYGGFPQLCPYGGKYSVKLGNDSIGKGAEGISYTFTVPTTVDTFTFTYFYAVVFENPGHPDEQQPRFFVTAYEVATGQIINCASYNYVSTGSLPGFNISPRNSGVLYKDWTPTSLQFAGLQGKQVRLEFRTADCTLGRHFGYAYLDVASGCTNILATAPYCIETNSLILNAPYGFQNYTWYNTNYSSVIGNQQSITLSPPPTTTGSYWVDCVPYPGYGCRDTFEARVKPLPVPDTPAATPSYTYCQNQFATTLTATASQGNFLLWYNVATGGTGSQTAPQPSTSTSGDFDYYVTQKALFGCESFRRKITVHVLPTPQPSFTISNVRQCQNGNNFSITNNTTNQQNVAFTWNFGDGNTLVTNLDTTITHTYSNSGQYNISLSATNGNTCTANASPKSVYVIPKPIANFTYPTIICPNQTTVALNDNSSVPNGLSTVTAWYWNIDGNTYTIKNPPSFIPTSNIGVQVKQVATTQEGCRSDTNYVILHIYTQPVASYTHNIPLCNNEVVNLSNQSYLPQTQGGESINTWYWTINSNTYNTNNVALYLPSGNNNISLISESNVGCKSKRIDSVLLVHAKPVIALSLNDSCVYVPINYQAIDLSNTVDKWYWNFSGSYIQANPSITKYYSAEGNNNFSLMGTTIYNCSDTIIRPFYIFKNKALAGKDTIAAKDEPVQLNAHGDVGEKYFWSPSRGLNSDTVENPVATYAYEQLYKLYSITKEGCKANSQILIKRYKGPELYIPTAFTPNNDGTNDVLKVFPVGISQFFYMSIYDRLGNLIFKTTDYSLGWNGTYKGVACMPGTYVVVAEAIDYKNNPMKYKGTVVLIR